MHVTSIDFSFHYFEKVEKKLFEIDKICFYKELNLSQKKSVPTVTSVKLMKKKSQNLEVRE